MDTRDVLLGADFGDRCHFSNLTRVKIERRQAVSWCDSTQGGGGGSATAEREPRRHEQGAAAPATGSPEPGSAASGPAAAARPLPVRGGDRGVRAAAAPC